MVKKIQSISFLRVSFPTSSLILPFRRIFMTPHMTSGQEIDLHGFLYLLDKPLLYIKKSQKFLSQQMFECVYQTSFITFQCFLPPGNI